MSDHTPGPWTLAGLDEVYGWTVIAGDHEQTVAAISDRFGEAAEQANGRLIAKAPDLFRELDHLSGHAPQAHYLCGDQEEWLASLRTARAIIAAVRGE